VRELGLFGDGGLMTQPHARDQWALKGAIARLKEIEDEIRSIVEVFPELKGSSRAFSLNVAKDSVGGLKGRKTMSPEARKRMSAGMRKFWARRKAEAKSSSKSKGATG
jgi:hypothetical protein